MGRRAGVDAGLKCAEVLNEGTQKGSPDRFQMNLNSREPAAGVLASKSRAGAPVRQTSRNHSQNAVSRVIWMSF